MPMPRYKIGSGFASFCSFASLASFGFGNFGATWQPFDDGSLDTVDCARPTACWASGANGRVAYLVRTR